MMQAMTKKYKRSKKQKGKQKQQSKSKRKDNPKYKRFVSRFKHKTLHPRFHRVKGFHYPLRIFPQRSLHKETTMVYTRPKYTTPTLSPLHKRQHKTNEIYKLLVTTKITNNLFYNFLQYLMCDGAQKVCERENQLK